MTQTLPIQTIKVLKAEFGSEIDLINLISSGDTNKAAQVQINFQSYFLKWHTNLVPGMYRAEVSGLELLRRTQLFKIPRVFFVNENCLILEWLEFDSSLKTDPQTQSQFGNLLAQLHQQTSAFYGLTSDNFIANLPQSNTPHPVWSRFYWGQRLKPQMEIARRRGHLTEKIINLMETLEEKIDDLLPKTPKASLLHGDLWSGNWGVTNTKEICIFDPAVYCGDREIDLAMTQLFGGFGSEFYTSYQAEFPLDTESVNRIKIYQLYPVWVHYNLFGKSYLPQLESLLTDILHSNYD